MKRLFIILFLLFPVYPGYGQTSCGDGSGVYGKLLDDLKSNLYENSRIKTVTLDGKDRRMFISWIRDHIHSMKAYKYWEKDMASYLAFFMGRQTPKGMKYEMSDPLRWSDKNLLVKQPYSIDTWDFTSEPDSLTGVERLLYHIGNFPETPKGIMPGDNTGMYRACKQLAEMYRAVGQPGPAKEWDLQGDLFLERTNNLCWNGKFYAHFIPEDPVPVHIKTDPVNHSNYVVLQGKGNKNDISIKFK